MLCGESPWHEDLREFLPPSKKRKPFLNSINTSTAFSAKTKVTWYDDGTGYIPDTFSEDMFFNQLANANCFVFFPLFVKGEFPT